MLFLALRHLSSRKGQTALMLAGITLGTAAYIAISGLMLGFQSFIIDQLVNNDAHVRVSAREELITAHSLDDAFFPEAKAVDWKTPPSGRRDDTYIEYPAGWFERLDHDSRVAAYSPQLVSQVIARRSKAAVSARLIGSDSERQVGVTNIERYMLEGRFKDIGGTGNRVAVGEGLLQKLGARIEEDIFVTSGQGRAVPMRIVGIFRLGVKTVDDTTLFGSLADVQKVNGTPSRVSDIAIRLTDVGDAGEFARTWAFLTREKVQSWDQANEGIMSVFRTQDVVRYSMTVSILVVAGFGIYNILNMAIRQKRREIAILRSIGFEPGDIVRLFQYQGMILGLAGGVLGVLIGFTISRFMGTLEVSPQRALGGTGRMIISFDPLIYVRAFALSFGISALAGLLPSWAAGRLTPIEIIRSEDS